MVAWYMKETPTYDVLTRERIEAEVQKVDELLVGGLANPSERPVRPSITFDTISRYDMGVITREDVDAFRKGVIDAQLGVGTGIYTPLLFNKLELADIRACGYHISEGPMTTIDAKDDPWYADSDAEHCENQCTDGIEELARLLDCHVDDVVSNTKTLVGRLTSMLECHVDDVASDVEALVGRLDVESKENAYLHTNNSRLIKDLARTEGTLQSATLLLGTYQSDCLALQSELDALRARYERQTPSGTYLEPQWPGEK